MRSYSTATVSWWIRSRAVASPGWRCSISSAIRRPRPTSKLAPASASAQPMSSSARSSRFLLLVTCGRRCWKRCRGPSNAGSRCFPMRSSSSTRLLRRIAGGSGIGVPATTPRSHIADRRFDRSFCSVGGRRRGGGGEARSGGLPGGHRGSRSIGVGSGGNRGLRGRCHLGRSGRSRCDRDRAPSGRYGSAHRGRG